VEPTQEWIAFAKAALEAESAAIRRASERLDEAFARALDLLDECRGKVVTTGVGKSGIAARKLAATLTSTGCAAVFLHPSEAMHGDLGIVHAEDVVIALSNGGESEELLAILPALLARGVPIVALVGNPQSTLARRATVLLDASVEREACPLNLAPTTSVLVQMALGDALAMALEKRRGFRPEDYALNHPGGRLGRRLTLRVRDVMTSGADAVPAVRLDTGLMDILCEISAKALGAAGVVDETGRLVGIITDYDARQAFQRFGVQSFALNAQAIMNSRPAVTVSPEELAYDALRRMEDRPRPVSVAPVVDGEGRFVGMVRVHDFVRAGL
jgi:arabinose-5-phosphate isomerase